MTQSTTVAPAAAPLPSPKERRRLREAKSLSEEQVAAAVGVTRATVRAWETGRTSPRGRKREVYARLIGSGGTRSASHPARITSATPNCRPRAAARQARSDEAARTAGAENARTAAAENGTTTAAKDLRTAAAENGTTTAAKDLRTAAAEAPAAPAAPAALAAAAATKPAAGSSAPKAAGPPATPSPKTRPPTPVEATGSDVMDPTEPSTTAPETPRPAEAPEVLEAIEVIEAAAAAEGAGGAGPSSAAEAFDALYQHAAASLYRQTYLLTGRRALAREAVGKAFEQTWQRWPEVAVDRDPVGWVRAAAHEYAMSPWHRLRREHRHPDPPPEAPGPRALLDVLLALPPSYRRTLLLHDGVGLGLPETAAETEASTPAAAGRLMNARAAVAEQLPELAKPSTPAEQSALLHEHLGALALTQPVPSLLEPGLIRTGCERKAELWTRAAIAFTVLLIGLTLITLATAPTRYETPQSPAQKVEGVPPLGGPQKLTPQDKKLRKKLGGELVRGPARLVPRAG
ncbi:helix-turn-helix domain-containing protein [Streptomyces sp. NPDC005426]|uniref:helix-turn-helix domain-containing protein n=1 Tax=Streptomyces sp. NPDC005426 TaxID=3155344 RepID=UPI0033AA7B38